jgi:hypothetical protein
MKEDGLHYFVRRNGTKKMAVIYPVKNDGTYTPAAICHICDTLGEIPKPEYAEKYSSIVKEVKDKANVLDDLPNRNMN